MKKFLLTLTATLFLTGIAMPTTESRADEPVDVKTIVDAVGRKALETEKIVGLSIGVAKGDSILHAQAFGLADVELNVPATRDTVFRIGSITKQFTAVGILLLIEDGKIQLDDPLSKFLPDYPAHAGKVTIKHLLQHTSGIKDFTRLPNYRKELPDNVTQEEVINRFKDLPLDFEPGEKHRYCNSGYFLLGVVIEKASGKSFDEFMEERVFKPADLSSTFCDAHARTIPNRASGYARWNDAVKNAPYINLKQTVGAGNLTSTAEDLLNWQLALVSQRLLKPESYKRTKGKLDNWTPISYGCGVYIRKAGKHDVIRHGGGISGFRSDLVYYPATKYAIVVLSNSSNTNTANLGSNRPAIAWRLTNDGL